MKENKKIIEDLVNSVEGDDENAVICLYTDKDNYIQAANGSFDSYAFLFKEILKEDTGLRFSMLAALIVALEEDEDLADMFVEMQEVEDIDKSLWN